MQRRGVLIAAAAAASPLLLADCGGRPVGAMHDLPSALRLLQGLPERAHTAEGWPLPVVLVHAAQSVEYSMGGFPEARSELYQATVGGTAFALFDALGSMSHDLADPIPGAPAIATDTPLREAAARLVKALTDFDGHTGLLQPHFAYGALDKAEYLRAHLMHLADHWRHYRAA
jgi:hypothetical protein